MWDVLKKIWINKASHTYSVFLFNVGGILLNGSKAYCVYVNCIGIRGKQYLHRYPLKKYVGINLLILTTGC